MADTATLAAPTVAERVAAGAAWLDQRQPDWWASIDLRLLDVNHCHRCVLGQMYGSYYRVEIDLDRAVALGFDGARAEDGGVVWDDFPALTAEWTRVITERREVEAARVAAACCPCRDTVCQPGCTCTDCPKTLAEVTDDAD